MKEIFTVDVKDIPKGMNIKEWLYYKDMGIVFIDSKPDISDELNIKLKPLVQITEPTRVLIDKRDWDRETEFQKSLENKMLHSQHNQGRASDVYIAKSRQKGYSSFSTSMLMNFMKGLHDDSPPKELKIFGGQNFHEQFSKCLKENVDSMPITDSIHGDTEFKWNLQGPPSPSRGKAVNCIVQEEVGCGQGILSQLEHANKFDYTPIEDWSDTSESLDITKPIELNFVN